MYWGFGLLPGTSKKWKVSPYMVQCWKSSKYDTRQDEGKAWFWRYLVSDTMPK